MPATNDTRGELQRRWETLSFDGRIEVLYRLMLDKCIEYGVIAPHLTIALQHSINAKYERAGAYDHGSGTITLYWDAGAPYRRHFDDFENAMNGLLHEVAHRIDDVQRDEGMSEPEWWQQQNDQYFNEKGEVDPHPNIYGAAAQWVEEYRGPNLDRLEHILAEGEALDWEAYGPPPPTQELPRRQEDWPVIDDIEAPPPAPNVPRPERAGQRRGKAPATRSNRGPAHPPRIKRNRDPAPAPTRDYPDDAPGDYPPSRFDQGRAVATLARWLRDPDYWLGDHSSVQLNRDYLHDIWQMAMRLSRGDEDQALTVAIGGVQTRRLPGESDAARDSRLAGVPFRAFGAHADFEGVELVSAFFEAALKAYRASLGRREAEGWLERAFAWLGGSLGQSADGAIGETWAQSLGTAFGAALQWNPDQSITRFLQRAPRADEALPIRLGVPMHGGYVSDIVVPSPESLAAGHPIEIRAVDRDGYARTYRAIPVRNSGKGTMLEQVRRSDYRLTRDDPWYFSDDGNDSQDDRRATLDEAADRGHARLDDQVASAREMRRRLFEDLQDLRLNQERLQREMDDRQRLDRQDDVQRLEWQQRETEQRMRETQSRIEQNDRVLQELHRRREDLNAGLIEQARASQTMQASQVSALEERVREYSAHAHDQQQRQVDNDRRAEQDRQEQRDRERQEREAREWQEREGRGRGGISVGTDVFTIAPANDPSNITIGGPGMRIEGDPRNAMRDLHGNP